MKGEQSKENDESLGGVGTSNFRTTTGQKFQNVEMVFLVDQNVESQKDQNVESVHLFSIKVIRTSKIKNINYLWRITYGYQGLWGFRLGSIRLG